MSTSLLSHGFGLRRYEPLRTYYEDGKIIFKIRKPSEESSVMYHKFIDKFQLITPS
jgi:hypothetical protein